MFVTGAMADAFSPTARGLRSRNGDAGGMYIIVYYITLILYYYINHLHVCNTIYYDIIVYYITSYVLPAAVRCDMVPHQAFSRETCAKRRHRR